MVLQSYGPLVIIHYDAMINFNINVFQKFSYCIAVQQICLPIQCFSRYEIIFNAYVIGLFLSVAFYNVIFCCLL